MVATFIATIYGKNKEKIVDLEDSTYEESTAHAEDFIDSGEEYIIVRLIPINSVGKPRFNAQQIFGHILTMSNLTEKGNSKLLSDYETLASYMEESRHEFFVYFDNKNRECPAMGQKNEVPPSRHLRYKLTVDVDNERAFIEDINP